MYIYIQVLEKKEWKSFRTMVANNRQLRRCGKKLPRYCDINNDRRISMTEWLSCLNAQRPTTGDIIMSFTVLFLYLHIHIYVHFLTLVNFEYIFS